MRSKGARLGMAQLRDQRTQPREAEMVVGLLEVDGAGDFGVHGGAAQLFGGVLLPDGGLHQRGSGEKEAAAFGHQHVVGHDREIRAAGDAHAHDGGDLRDAHGGHDGVVAEDAAEVVLIGEDIFLQREEDAGTSRRGRGSGCGSPWRWSARAGPSWRSWGRRRRLSRWRRWRRSCTGGR